MPDGTDPVIDSLVEKIITRTMQVQAATIKIKALREEIDRLNKVIDAHVSRTEKKETQPAG